MYKQIKLKKLGRKKSHRESLVRNLLISLFENGKVETTSAKAKALKASAESLIESSKDVANQLDLRRKLQITFGNTDLVKKFMEYTKVENNGVTIVKVGFRSGDNAEVSRVELMGIEKKVKKVVKGIKSEKKVEKTIEKKDHIDIEKRSANKSISKGTVVKKTERAKSRSGL